MTTTVPASKTKEMNIAKSTQASYQGNNCYTQDHKKKAKIPQKNAQEP